MDSLNFNVEKFDRETFKRCEVTYKGVHILNIEFEKGWSKEYDYFFIKTPTSNNNLISFMYIDFKPENDLDFISKYKKCSTFESAKENCKLIMGDFINWLKS